jgi:uncharacterized protein YutE (UPF0331/DUF86 family)
MSLYIKKIEIIEDSLKKLKEINSEIKTFRQYKSSWRYKDIAERNLHKIIEAIIDIGKIIISSKKLKEPATNREVFEILSENNLFPLEFLDLTDKMLGLRNIIVHSYDRIDDSVIYGILKKNLTDIEKIKDYFTRVSGAAKRGVFE